MDHSALFGDLYHLQTEIAYVQATANLRGYYRDVDLTHLEDLGEAVARIVEQELRDRATGEAQ